MDSAKQIFVTESLMPSYYKQFQCAADQCRDTCCGGWRITFNKRDYLTIKHALEASGQAEGVSGCMRRIRKGVFADQFYAEFQMEDGKCRLLSDCGLCSLQLTCGPNALPKVCNEFPRICVDMRSGYQERSLSPACEAVLELLWNLPEGIDFLAEPLPQERFQAVVPKQTTPRYLAFQEVRSVCIDILQARAFSLPQRMLLLGIALQEMQKYGEELNVGAWSAWVAALLEDGGVTEALTGNRRMFILNNARLLMLLPVGGRVLQETRQDILKILNMSIQVGESSTGEGFIDFDTYDRAETAFRAAFGNSEYFFENLMVSIFFHMKYPALESAEELWKSYVNLCNLFSFYRFMAVMSCAGEGGGSKEALFRSIVLVSRSLIHSTQSQNRLRDELFQNDSATLAHMAILVLG